MGGEPEERKGKGTVTEALTEEMDKQPGGKIFEVEPKRKGIGSAKRGRGRIEESLIKGGGHRKIVNIAGRCYYVEAWHCCSVEGEGKVRGCLFTPIFAVIDVEKGKGEDPRFHDQKERSERK